MRVLVDIVHPADVLFFARPIEQLLAEGHEVRVLSRHKDIATELLDELGIEHDPISRLREGRPALASEMLLRDARMLATALRFRPDVLVGFGGVAVAHVGAILRRRSVAFYDSESGTLQMKLTLPLIREWHVPRGFSGPEADGRTARYNGIKELSYFHPNGFRPDLEKAIEAGLDPDRENFFVRLVGWDAAHDLGKEGLAPGELLALISWLEERGKVHLSVEGWAPKELRRLLLQCSPLLAHHLMAYCVLYAGESATMAAEAAVLGTPGFFLADFDLGYIRELEAAGLVEHYLNSEDLLPAMADALYRGTEHYHQLRDSFVGDRIDVAEYVVDVVKNGPAQGNSDGN